MRVVSRGAFDERFQLIDEPIDTPGTIDRRRVGAIPAAKTIDPAAALW